MIPRYKPLLLLILAAIYPPRNTAIPIVISIIYCRYSTGGSDVAVSIPESIHISTAITTTDETAPIIIELRNLLLLLSK